MRVGVSEDPPFIIRSGEEATGIEADLIRGFAAELGAKPKWIWEPQERQFEALGAFELDLAAGGITAKSPWKKKVALTRGTLTVHEVLASASGFTPPADLEGVEVTIEDGDPVGEKVEKEKATVKRVPHLASGEKVVAGSLSRIASLGYASRLTLDKHDRALAVPPGENAFLEQLERYLAAHHTQFVRAAGEFE